MGLWTLRKSFAVLSSAAAAVAASFAIESVAQAGLVIDLVARPGSGYTIDADGKTAHAVSGATIELAVYARLTGASGFQHVGEFAGASNSADIKNDEALQIITGSFASSAGGLLGDFDARARALKYDSRVAPFNGPGSQNGVASDIDGDGDLDVGATGTNVTNMWVARAASPTSAALIDGGTNGWATSSGAWGVQSDNAIVDSSSSRLRVGTLYFTVTDPHKGNTLLNFIPRPDPGPGSGLWWEDDVITGHTPGTDPIGTGPGVMVVVNPEPASGFLALAAGGIGLLSRRRHNRR